MLLLRNGKNYSMNYMGKKIVTTLLLIFLCVRVGSLLYQHKDKYIPNYWTRYETLKSVYGESQYSMKEWKFWLPDETVYAYAGGAYIKGANPILVESTQPPLGKYLIGLSIAVTQNENTIVAQFFCFLLGGIFILIQLMTGNSSVAFIGVLIASYERLFVDQLLYTPLLDIFHITFILYVIITASYAMKKSKPGFLLLSFILLAASMMTKVWVMGFVYTVAISFYVLIKKPKYSIYIGVGGLLIVASTLLVYSRLIIGGYSIIEILKVQKWLYWYHNSKINRFFTIWPLIFMNKWYVWWGEVPVITDSNWSFSWPIVIGSGMAASLYEVWSIVKKTNPAVQISAFSIIAYAVFISLGQASARYLLPFLPICYSIMVWAVYEIGKRVFMKRGKA